MGPAAADPGPPSIRLADNGKHARDFPPGKETAALLVSYVYLRGFETAMHKYEFRDWALDSGAFSAHNSGKDVRLQDYIDCCKRVMDWRRPPAEIFSLDVIGDWRAGLANAEEMRTQGIPVIPTYHFGEPEHVLRTIAGEYPKIALGAVARMKGDLKMEWAEECFARVWPKRVHGFAYCGEQNVMVLPFHSVDAASWALAPSVYGKRAAFHWARASMRGGGHDLRAEVEYYLRLEKQARSRWAKEMAMLEAQG